MNGRRERERERERERAPFSFGAENGKMEKGHEEDSRVPVG